MRFPSFIILSAGLLMVPAQAQSTAAAATNSAPPKAELEPARDTWEVSISALTYIVPDSREYVQPTITADLDWFHTEARYNYEDLDTGSAWLGINFSGGNKLAWEITPMIGGVFGETSGVAPGYRGSLSWWKLQLYSEGEYVWDFGDTSESFFYSWTELTLSPVEWFRFGLVTQRTQVYQSDREVQRGLLAGISVWQVDLTTYVFNPDDSDTIWVVGVGFNF
jgi:hypothetical protein